MYAIGCKFPTQTRFRTMDIKTGEQVNNWMHCTLFETEQRANEVLNALKQIVKPDVDLMIMKYKCK